MENTMNKNSNIHHRWSGINTKSLSLRISEGEHPKKAKADFFRDFGEILEEWWSLYENEISITRTGVKAKVKRVKRYNSGAGVGSSIHSEISVDMRSDLTVYVGGQSKKFSADESLYNIMLWVDRIAEKRGAYASDQELRKKVIRLAYEQPQLRKDILPLLTKSADRVQVINKKTKKPVSVEEETLKDPKKKKLYAPLKKDEGKDKKENVSGKWDRTLQERAENILRNIEEKEQKGSDHLDSMLKKFKNMSDSRIESWLEYVEEYETEKAPPPPKFKDKKEKEQMEKEEAQKSKNLSEQKSSEKLFGKKKIDDLMSSLDKFLPDNSTYAELKAINKEINGPGVMKLMLSKDMHRDMKRDLEKALKENRRNNKGQWKNMADKDIEKLFKDLEKTKKDNPHPVFVKEVDKIIKDIKESSKGSEKKASLRSKLVRLAYQNPSIRADVLPLLKTSADFTKEELYDRGFYRQIQRELGRHRDITFGCCSASSTDNREALLVVVSLKDQWQYPHEEDYDGWEEILKKMKSAVSRVRELNKFDYYFDTYKIENHQDIDARIYIYGRK